MDKFDATDQAESVEETPELHGDDAPASPELHGDGSPSSPELHGDTPASSPAKAVEDEESDGSAFPLED
jgi:hypothetical protein